MKKILLIEKRKKARQLKAEGWSIRQIAGCLVCNKKSVNRWLNLSEENVETDNRGWPKGKLRKHTQLEKKRIIAIRDNLERNESFFVGSEVIQSDYAKSYGEKLSKWFINSTLKESNRVKGYKPKARGGSKYKRYPVQTLSSLGKCVMAIDFIGPKYLEGSGNRINFFSSKYIRPCKVGMICRISGQTSEEAVKVLQKIWSRHSIPDLVKMDNDSAFGGNLSHVSSIGRVTMFLLNLGVKPLYIAPRSPWNNSDVEGFNSVFSRKFWTKLQFKNELEIDVKIEAFNFEYEEYSELISNTSEVEAPKYITDVERVDFTNRDVGKFLENVESPCKTFQSQSSLQVSHIPTASSYFFLIKFYKLFYFKN